MANDPEDDLEPEEGTSTTAAVEYLRHRLSSLLRQFRVIMVEFDTRTRQHVERIYFAHGHTVDNPQGHLCFHEYVEQNGEAVIQIRHVLNGSLWLEVHEIVDPNRSKLNKKFIN